MCTNAKIYIYIYNIIYITSKVKYILLYLKTTGKQHDKTHFLLFTRSFEIQRAIDQSYITKIVRTIGFRARHILPLLGLNVSFPQNFD